MLFSPDADASIAQRRAPHQLVPPRTARKCVIGEQRRRSRLESLQEDSVNDRKKGGEVETETGESCRWKEMGSCQPPICAVANRRVSEIRVDANQGTSPSSNLRT